MTQVPTTLDRQLQRLTRLYEARLANAKAALEAHCEHLAAAFRAEVGPGTHVNDSLLHGYVTAEHAGIFKEFLAELQADRDLAGVKRSIRLYRTRIEHSEKVYKSSCESLAKDLDGRTFPSPRALGEWNLQRERCVCYRTFLGELEGVIEHTEKWQRD